MYKNNAIDEVALFFRLKLKKLKKFKNKKGFLKVLLNNISRGGKTENN